MAIDINIPSQVKNYANLAAFPATGTLKTIFIANDTNKTYRWTGSAYVEISPAGATGITIGTTAITSGTVGRVLFEGTGNVVQESGNLFWDNTNGRLGIGGTPTQTLDINGNFRIAKSTFSSLFAFNSGGFGGDASYIDTLYPINGGLRLVPNFATSFDGATFQMFGGTTPTLAGQMYFDYGSQARTITTRSANWRNMNLGSTTNVLTLTANSNVLINTTTDAGYKLDVNGTARVVGSMLIQGMTVGLGGGANVNSVAIGKEALQNNTTYQNCAVGYRALYNNTGGDNTAIGAFYAMFANTTGSRNTGIGTYALNGNTTGQYNTALGYNTSSGNFSNSTILGYGAAASADNQFVVGSSAVNAGAVTSEVNASTQVWNVIINGVARKILLA